MALLVGKIPLRQLVYRVLDLPPSMRPLVYDFGRLNLDTEMDYIDQIVQNHVRYYNYADIVDEVHEIYHTAKKTVFSEKLSWVCEANCPCTEDSSGVHEKKGCEIF